MNSSELLYLDYNATAPMLPVALEAMLEALRSSHGNPSSVHRSGTAARYLVEKSRRQIARLINAPRPENIIFTSGGSESNSLALRGTCFCARRKGKGSHLIVSAAEHKAVLEAAQELRDFHGFALTIIDTDGEGRVRPDTLRAALRDDTVLVSLMVANNEVGSINDIAELASVVKNHSRAAFHGDAVQAFGKIPMDVSSVEVEMFSLSAHKIGGPKGIGALYIRDGHEIERQISGGTQEQELRAGTENVPGIVGFASAALAAVLDMEAESQRLAEAREAFWTAIAHAVPSAVRISPATRCLPNTLNISIPGIGSQPLVRELDAEGYAVSSGSACTSGGETAQSHVLLAMGCDAARAEGALRISLGPGSAAIQARPFAQVLADCVQRLSTKETNLT